MNSIKRKLTWLLIAIITLFTFSAALAGYRASMQDAANLFDVELRSISAILMTVPVDTEKHLPVESGTELIWLLWEQQTLKAHSKNSPEMTAPPAQSGSFEKNINGVRWQVLVSHIAERTVLVGYPIRLRHNLTESLILSAMTPFIFSLPFLALLVYFVIRQNLAPLHQLSLQLKLKRRNNLEPIVLTDIPQELQTVVATLNSLLERLHAAFEREQRFAGNAAHELRTPLSVLKINLHNLAASTQPKIEDITQCQRDTDRMINVVNQLLLLSRTNPDTVNSQLEEVDLEQLCQHVISDYYPHIDNKGQTIELMGSRVSVWGIRFALETLLVNLIGNASKYTPDGGHIELNLLQQNEHAIVEVADSGPGIPETQRDNVLIPFVRMADKNTRQQSGSGLGLAIVAQIITLHEGQLSLDDSHLGGLKVSIQLPLHLSRKDAAV